MTIHVNNERISGVYYGNQKIRRVYYGNYLVYSGNITITLNVVPETANIIWTVEGNEISGKSVTVEYGTTVNYEITASGYLTETGTLTATEDKEITVEMTASDFPREWGKFLRGYCTLTLDATDKDWLYVWSLHFENGVLPVIVGKDASAVDIDESLYEEGASSSCNSASYKNSAWINSIAADGDSVMSWESSAGARLNSILYSTASLMGWPNNSVFTNVYEFSLSGNSLRIISNGSIFKTLTVYV